MTKTVHTIKIVSKAEKANTFVAECSCGHWAGYGKYKDGPMIISNAHLHQSRNGAKVDDA